MAEILCKETGCCKGMGGSMHLCDVTKAFWGTNAIVAAHIPIAGGWPCGQAAAKRPRDGGLFGDGASCEGVFYETLNMAVLTRAALVFVCENNGYAISVPTRGDRGREHRAARGRIRPAGRDGRRKRSAGRF